MERLVTSMPLEHLWRGAAAIEAIRAGPVGAERIREALRTTDTPIVIATINAPLVWIEGTARFAAWKDEIQPRLVPANSERHSLEAFPDCRCYVASEWIGAMGPVAILLEEHH